MPEHPQSSFAALIHIAKAQQSSACMNHFLILARIVACSFFTPHSLVPLPIVPVTQCATAVSNRSDSPLGYRSLYGYIADISSF